MVSPLSFSSCLEEIVYNMSSKEATFDWAGEAGAEFAKWNPPTAEGVDTHWMEYYGKPATQIMERALAAMKKEGLDFSQAKGAAP